jgi:spore germination cell wall hydrolase CwlJ-like protein
LPNGGEDLADIRTGRLISDDTWGILTIYAEARGEPYEGKVAVGNVIRHRTKRHFFSSGSIVSTVTSPYQFSYLNTGDGQRTHVLESSWESEGMRECSRAWFESEVHEIVPEATHYHATSVEPPWATADGMTLVAQIGRHRFFREQVIA